MSIYVDEYKERQRLEAEQRAEAVAFFGESRSTPLKRPRPTQTRPTCPWCGKLYGNRATKYTTKHYPVGTPIEPYQGNAHLVCESVKVGAQMGPNHQPGAYVTRETWDGVSYRSSSGTDPFCTNTCAFSFAVAAYHAGFRRKP